MLDLSYTRYTPSQTVLLGNSQCLGAWGSHNLVYQTIILRLLWVEIHVAVEVPLDLQLPTTQSWAAIQSVTEKPATRCSAIIPEFRTLLLRTLKTSTTKLAPGFCYGTETHIGYRLRYTLINEYCGQQTLRAAEVTCTRPSTTRPRF